jgi:hypothetical protein
MCAQRLYLVMSAHRTKTCMPGQPAVTLYAFPAVDK